MINRESRREAMAIAAGKNSAEDTNDKVALYGLLAKSLGGGSLADLSVPPAHNFRELWTTTGLALSEVAINGYLALDSADRQEAEELFAQRHSRAQAIRKQTGGQVEAGPYIIATACLSAASRETLTLRTIARGITEGIPVTERGVQLSGRVPHSLALLHLYDLQVEQTSYREAWESSQGDGGQVLTRSAALLDPEEGLKLVVTPEFSDTEMRDRHGPQIGCPATMIQGYIQEVHRIVANSAMESGLIVPT